MPVKMTVTTRSSGYIAGVLRPSTKRYMTPKVQRAKDAVVAAAPLGKPDGVGRTPGRLKRSVRMYVRDSGGRFSSGARGVPVCSYEVAVEVPYAAAVIHGLPARRITVKRAKTLYNSFTGVAFGPRVDHPGHQGNDFLTRAMKESGF